MASRQPDGPPPPPPVQKLRLQYAKRGRLRFSSHRDFQRALERAIRRARLPMAYSAGFNPHPKISYANAAPTGAASEAEYFEVSLIEVRDPDEVRASLDAALPEGLDIVACVNAAPGALADRLDVAHWSILLPGVAVPQAEAAVGALMAKDSHVVQRVTKAGTRDIDVRKPIIRLEVSPGTTSAGEESAQLDMWVRHVSPAVRPDDVVSALNESSGMTTRAAAVITRLSQGPWDGSQIGDPLGA